MPRHRRLELPTGIYHVIARGIEHCQIFKDDGDREEFVRRLSKAIKETGCKCYGWALMPNHFHLLIRMGVRPLSDLMRKLLTGYAVYFNSRYKRVGYLYQNRYKSILCQEDKYLLELVRYIHLNPLRSGIVKNIEELNKYGWCGHSVIIKQNKKDWQTTEEVLSHFSKKFGEAIKRYQEFIKDGAGIGKRSDLTGGGLRRSAGGWSGVLSLRNNNERWQGDERVLGDGNFVESVLKASEESMVRKDSLKRDGWDYDKLLKRVCGLIGVEKEELKKRGKKNKIAYAKALIAYWGKNELGMKGTEIGRFLGVSKQAVSLLVPAGEKYAKENNCNLTS